MPIVQFSPVDSIAIDLPNVEIRNYHRNDDYIVNLSYPDYCRQMLNRYKRIDIKTLQYLKGTINSNFRQSNYMNYHTRLLDTNNQSKIRKVLKTQCSM